MRVLWRLKFETIRRIRRQIGKAKVATKVEKVDIDEEGDFFHHLPTEFGAGEVAAPRKPVGEMTRQAGQTLAVACNQRCFFHAPLAAVGNQSNVVAGECFEFVSARSVGTDAAAVT